MSKPVISKDRCDTVLTLSESMNILTNMLTYKQITDEEFKFMFEVIFEEFKLVRKYQKLNEISINKALSEKL